MFELIFEVYWPAVGAEPARIEREHRLSGQVPGLGEYVQYNNRMWTVAHVCWMIPFADFEEIRTVRLKIINPVDIF